MIDGGSASAYRYSISSNGFAIYPNAVDNSGTMRSTGTASTILLPTGYPTINNSGTIANGGAGMVINASGGLSLTNKAGATISSTGSVAIRAASTVSLVNRGSVIGSVDATSSTFATVDTVGGSIRGDVLLGGGDDRLTGTLNTNTGGFAEISGRIDGGGGTNTAEFQVGADATLNAYPTPVNFQQLQFTLVNGAALTVTGARTSNLMLAGNGRFTNAGAITTTGPALKSGYSYISAIAFTNTGTITATLARPTDYAVQLGNLSSFTNASAITAVGGRGIYVNLNLSNGSFFANDGTITATGTALTESGAQAATNRGTIRSTAEVGARLSGTLTNIGLIEGVTTGVAVDYSLFVNAGTVRAVNGIGLTPGTYSIINNQSGGVISGTVAGIALGNSSNYYAIIRNAGTVDGDVSFVQNTNVYGMGGDYYIDEGGIINGSLRLGTNGLLVTDYSRIIGGRFVGATGDLDAGADDDLLLRVGNSATIDLASLPNFGSLGFDIAGQGALTLTASRPLGATVALTGDGKVDLTADLTTVNRPVLDLDIQSYADIVRGSGYPSVSTLNVVSHGALSFTRTSGSSGLVAVALGQGSSTFENVGTLSINGGADYDLQTIGISGSSYYAANDAVINSGTIMLAGAGTIVSGVASLVNSGRIATTSTGVAAVGVSGVPSVTNSGSIETTGVAIASGSYDLGVSIANSGRIASTGAEAIRLSQYASYTDFRVENKAGGIILGGNGTAISAGSRTTVINAGAITGDVLLLSSQYGGGSTYIGDGGSVTGRLTFGAGDDLLVVRNADGSTGVSGPISGGAGRDTYVRSYSASTTASLGTSLPTGFEREGLEARGGDTVVTVTGAAPTLVLIGDGNFVNRANLGPAADDDAVTLLIGQTDPLRYFGLSADTALGTPLSVSNEAVISGSVNGLVQSFSNSGTINSANNATVSLQGVAAQQFTFANSGTVSFQRAADADDETAIELSHSDFDGSAFRRVAQTSVINSGTIVGQTYVETSGALSIRNSGTMSTVAPDASTLQVFQSLPTEGSSVGLDNSGTIRSAGDGAAAVSITLFRPDQTMASSATITNSGRIETLGRGFIPDYGTGPVYFEPAVALVVGAGVDAGGSAANVVNASTGVLSATGRGALALASIGQSLVLDNAGTISGGSGVTLDPVEVPLIGGFNPKLTNNYLPGAILSGDQADMVRNTGSITGSIDLGGGDDRIENYGTITGDVFLRSGDDTFLQSARGSVTGLVDGGEGLDSLIVDATGGGGIDASRFVNFERFSQIGSGNVAYSGSFTTDTIRLDNSSLTVAAGQQLSTTGPVTVTGGDGMESVVNRGTITGGIDLGGGSDSVENYGRIGGPVQLGAGDDSYTEGAGSSVPTVEGGDGTDTYIVALSGDRSGVGARTGFERLAVTGTGKLSLTLDQDFATVQVSGTALDLTRGTFAVGGVEGSEAAETVTLDRDVPRVALGGGDDRLSVGGQLLAGSYDGGSGNDSLVLPSTGPVTLSGTVASFESVTLAGGALTISGTLGANGAAIGFGDGAQTLIVASGGRLLGTVDLGAGADSFRLAAGGQLLGTVSGGAGSDVATLDLGADLTLSSGTLRDFETLVTTGGRTLTFGDGSVRYDRIEVGGNLTVASGASLGATQVQFGGGDDRFMIAGAFTGSADGGAGNDTLAISGGTAAAPVAFQTIGNFESMAVSGGVTTIAGTAQLGRIDVTGGRLIGLTGSTISAPTVAVAAGGTFGSAGTVVGNLAVSGTLSPGASPGTMTVTGNVSLASGSTTLLEFTPSVSDRLNISGTLAIAGGATLSLTGERPLTPGAALDLIVAGGGITGSFATINQASTVFGFVRQSSDRIQLFGQFGSAGFNSQVTRTINYVNAVLTSGKASSALIAAIPSLLTSGNASNGAAFARLNPEAYASATQIGVQNGLTLAKAARTEAAAGHGTGAFTFAQGLGDWRGLDGSATQGTSRGTTSSYGVMGGVGFGLTGASIGGFVGYLDTHQRIAGLDAQTDSDGVIAGLIGHVAAGGFDLAALVAYDGGHADTRRALPGSGTARARYGLQGWTGDVSLGYALPLVPGWTLKPQAGFTYTETRRGGATETGSTAFALDVAGRHSHATFVDGALTVAGTLAGTVRPWLSAGVRHQLNGRATFATAAFAGVPTTFSVLGLDRRATRATAAAGLAVSLLPNVDLFGAYQGEFGSDGTGTNLNGGLRVRF